MRKCGVAGAGASDATRWPSLAPQDRCEQMCAVRQVALSCLRAEGYHGRVVAPGCLNGTQLPDGEGAFVEGEP